MRGYGQDGVVERIRSAGGEIYAITSEPQRLASQARADWGIDFETVGDPHHEISAACRNADFLNIFVNTDTARFDQVKNSPYSHPKGHFQPGVLALTAEGRVLYRWRSRPTRENMGGATNRPTANHVFEKISEAFTDSPAPGRPADAALDTDPEVDSRGMAWHRFLPLLVANGWFLRPITFGQAVGGPSAAERMKRAGLRIPIFLAAWVAALVLLPKIWVVLAFVAWAAWLVPQIRKVNRQFQPILPEDE